VGARSTDPSTVRQRVIDQLARLPPDEHLDALHAIDAGEVYIDVTDPRVIRIELAGRWIFEVPAVEWDGF
jgi:hypothetical protein